LAQSYSDVGRLRRDTGKIDESLQLCQIAMELASRVIKERPEDPTAMTMVARCSTDVAELYIYHRVGNLVDAIAAEKLALGVHERLAAEHPTIVKYSFDAAASWSNYGQLQLSAGNFSEAVEAQAKALALRIKVARDDPSNQDAQLAVAVN